MNEKCENCLKYKEECKGEQELHTCPFRSEINDDDETLCNCCDYQMDKCANDV